MNQRKVGVPSGARVDPEPKRMILRQAEIVRTALIDERERARGSRVPRVCGDHVQGRPQLRFERVQHVPGYGHSVQYFTIGGISPAIAAHNRRGYSFLRWTENCGSGG